jgi:hypothetical protein
VLIIIALLVITAASIYVGLNSDSLVQGASSSSESSAAAPVRNGVEKTVTQKDFQAFQRETTDFLQSVAQDVAAQKADLKTLSDQVAALVAKIDAQQSAVEPTPPHTAVQPPGLTRPAVTSSHKKPAPVKPTGPISVGGAPLPPTGRAR